jgi:hypothetical protein
MRKRLKKKLAKKPWKGVFSYEIMGDEVIINSKVFAHPNSPFTAKDFQDAMQSMIGKPYPKPQAFYAPGFIPFDIMTKRPLRCICEECLSKRLRGGGMFNAETP